LPSAGWNSVSRRKAKPFETQRRKDKFRQLRQLLFTKLRNADVAASFCGPGTLQLSKQGSSYD